MNRLKPVWCQVSRKQKWKRFKNDKFACVKVRGEGGNQNSKGIQKKKKEGKIINKAERDAAAVPVNGYI